ncbi:KTSC domain-containing protein [Pararhizobium antarcticum]|uniref:KTSC domain-containing protein n=1 Tax=Pararhizobium antarcticum TaxID=1798805 RepID=A0A657LRE6_9HYPH|nr:KTSC domain-containing protein [Pararhizobium antarcticum]OJF92010.1 hypothetical protein AX761_05865 [Rhizobium sp. 58]OJF96038.1 hypothetical protein AX760_18455 [Pararhizobium antarcticum]
MQNLPVQSRIIKSVWFSREDGRLLVCFKSGEERRFEGVLEDVVLNMVAAPSPGQHYIDHIRTKFKRLAA